MISSCRSGVQQMLGQAFQWQSRTRFLCSSFALPPLFRHHEDVCFCSGLRLAASAGFCSGWNRYRIYSKNPLYCCTNHLYCFTNHLYRCTNHLYRCTNHLYRCTNHLYRCTNHLYRCTNHLYRCTNHLYRCTNHFYRCTNHLYRCTNHLYCCTNHYCHYQTINHLSHHRERRLWGKSFHAVCCSPFPHVLYVKALFLNHVKTCEDQVYHFNLLCHGLGFYLFLFYFESLCTCLLVLF
ncbi:uncharacterized protein LOC133460801 [Cololabis saira]|uniref:uncharacterized protein LOC133460801 n=1 Tax=Cololabis saira TaxID=129043 RepID=UPI002AD41442|nr:uncharacterized protein LOC133460801 [Cololabis saira]